MDFYKNFDVSVEPGQKDENILSSTVHFTLILLHIKNLRKFMSIYNSNDATII